VQDENGDSPFYKNLAQHFFRMDFRRADFIHATQGGQFISDLMPRYPIYVNLLDQKAQEVIGVPLQASLPAMTMLQKEGFRHQGYVDAFDAGPTMQAERKAIRTVRKSMRAAVTEIRPVSAGLKYMVATTMLPDFCITLCPLEETKSGVAINAETAELLKLKKGDPVRYIPM
jgi:arginine N-succinyltransferase